MIRKKSSAVDREGRPYRLCPKASVRLPVAETKQLLWDDYSSIEAMLTLLWNATINASITSRQALYCINYK